MAYYFNRNINVFSYLLHLLLDLFTHRLRFQGKEVEEFVEEYDDGLNASQADGRRSR